MLFYFQRGKLLSLLYGGDGLIGILEAVRFIISRLNVHVAYEHEF